ncbi:MAG: allantoicase [Candidatus Obscuribacterales bacterium]|nr:allantoicase [Candidatus Obscuribacterales bacterium]
MERNFNVDAAAFAGTTDLVSELIGGRVLYATDDFFAEKENLIKAGRGVFIADKYTERGKWMDGWESRRKRVPGHDWCVLELGVPGLVRGVDIDTNHFLGNSPTYASIDALVFDKSKGKFDPASEHNNWTEILPKSALKQGSQNIFAVASGTSWTHLRLNIYPDGGVARFRVYGNPTPNWSGLKPGDVIDLAAVEHGGLAVAASDMFFGNKENLIMPGRAVNMGGGWETKRRRGPGYDWAIVKLGHAGILKKIEIDTNHYKGNYPDNCWIDGTYSPNVDIDILNWNTVEWTPVMTQQKLQADHRHFYEKEIAAPGPWTHIRLNIAPDGGISRLRLFGIPHLDSSVKKEVGSATKSY